jgi:hypothetical protein
MLYRRLFAASACAIAAVLALGWTATPRAEAHGGKLDRLLSAVYEMREAEGELKTAAHDFGGHRKFALQALEAAVVQCEKLLTEAGVPLKYVTRKVEDYPKGHGQFPHLREALVDCEAARKLLEQSKEKWGHREQAIRDLNTAIEQLRIAEKYAK